MPKASYYRGKNVLICGGSGMTGTSRFAVSSLSSSQAMLGQPQM